jgi:hypothetical protein
MEIKPTYVTFKQAKLLKEKDYKIRSEARYGIKSGILYKDAHINDKEDNVFYSAPEQWQVVEWLRVNHGIWIYIDMTGSEKFYPRYRYIDKNGQHYVGDFKDDNNERFLKDTPQEAYSAAFDYIFNNNLI